MRKVRIIEVVTETGQVAGKFTWAREIEIRPEGTLVIGGRVYEGADLERHLETLIGRVQAVLGSAAVAPGTLRYRANANRQELARRINALQSEICDNGYSPAEASRVLSPLRRRLDEWIESFTGLDAA
jgi:hypothetical protein